MRSLWYRLQVGSSVFLLAAVCLAQTDRGAISGTVTDPTGAAVGGAKLTVTQEATGVQIAVSTSTAGVYTAPQLQAAVYRVEVESPGFKKAIWSDVRVGVLQTLTLDFRLELGSVQDSVTVAGEVPLLTPASAAISTSVSPREYQDLPIFFGGGFRSALGLVALLPGVNSAKGGTHISGGQSNSRDFQLDGVSVTTAEVQGDGRGFQVPVDTIQEFSIITNSFSAEFGRTGGGVESYTLKSGTNRLHGMAYEYIRNDAFEARGFYAPSVPIAKQHDLGGNIGGPVILPKIYNGKNKTFFFFNYSAYRLATAGGNFLATVPSLKFRDGNFTEQVDTRGAPIPIYDPATTRTVTAGQADPGTGLIATKNAVIRDAFGFDPKTGQPRLIEPTVGRTDYQSFLAVANGVNIPETAYRDLAGIEPRTPPRARTRPVKYFVAFKDFRSALRQVREGQESWPGYLRSLKGRKVFALLHGDDPGPLLYRIHYATLGRLLRVARRTFGRN